MATCLAAVGNFPGVGIDVSGICEEITKRAEAVSNPKTAAPDWQTIDNRIEKKRATVGRIDEEVVSRNASLAKLQGEIRELEADVMVKQASMRQACSRSKSLSRAVPMHALCCGLVKLIGRLLTLLCLRILIRPPSSLRRLCSGLRGGKAATAARERGSDDGISDEDLDDVEDDLDDFMESGGADMLQKNPKKKCPGELLDVRGAQEAQEGSGRVHADDWWVLVLHGHAS